MRLRRQKEPANSGLDVLDPVDTEADVASVNNDFTIKPGGARLGEMLVDANLLTEKQLVDSLELVKSKGGGLLGRVLVEMGLLDERELARVLAEQRSLDVIDLRRTVPDSRGHGAAVGEAGTRAAGDPGVDRRARRTGRRRRPDGQDPGRTAGGDRQARAARRRRTVRHPPRDHQQLPGAGRHRYPGSGVRGARLPAQDRRRGGHRDGQRLRAGGPGGAAAHHPGVEGPGIRHPHRAAGGRGTGPLPHRRSTARGHVAPGSDGSGDREPHQDPRAT